MRHGNHSTPIDWQRRNGPASMNTSPARSTLSLSSTVNIYQTAPVHSTTTTPGKVPPPSPLYYDYTEEFDIDDYNQPEAQEPPPQFRIEQTIPEDRPLISGWQLEINSEINGQNGVFPRSPKGALPKPSDLQGVLSRIQEHHTGSYSGDDIFDPIQTETEQLIPLVGITSITQSTYDLIDRREVRLSGLGIRAQELNRDVEEAFGLVSSPSFELLTPDGADNAHEEAARQTHNSSGSIFAGVDKSSVSGSIRHSAQSLNTHLQSFPPPPLAAFRYSEPEGETSRPKDVMAAGPYPTVLREIEMNSRSIARSLPVLPCKNPSSLSPIRGSDSTADRLQNTRDGDTARDTPQKPPKLLLNLSDESPLNKISSLRQKATFFAPNHHKSSNRAQPEQLIRWRDHRGKARRVEAATVPIYADAEVPNFSHQIPRKLISRSESPMIAPKPISPARQLKLKNSIPQLMKALPPLPPERPFGDLPPALQLSSTGTRTPDRLSPFTQEMRLTTQNQSLSVSTLSDGPHSIVTMECASELVELASTAEQSVQTTLDANEAHPPKLKLKMRSNVLSRPRSPPDSRPWNLDESYPWADQIVKVGIPLSTQKEKPSDKPLKFKLKITRASNSTLGTVRVDRKLGSDNKESTYAHLRSPKDLFTQTSSIDGIFRQVSKHLHPGRESAPSSENISERQMTRSILNTSIGTPPSGSGQVGTHPSSKYSASLSPSDARSCFSNNSSGRNGRSIIRKRLTYLKDRISIPYVARSNSQLCYSVEGTPSKEIDDGSFPATPASSSRFDHPSSRSGAEAEKCRRSTGRLRAQRFRERVSGWFKEARNGTQRTHKALI